LKLSFITKQIPPSQHTPGEGTTSENLVLLLDLFCSVCELHMYVDAVAAALLRIVAVMLTHPFAVKVVWKISMVSSPI
jgi:hypothetical protein